MDHCGKEQRKQNPREKANLLSLLTFSYTIGLFKKAFKNDLEEKDLYDVLRKIKSKKCGDGLEKKWIIENKRDAPPSIYRLMWKRFGWRYILLGFVHFVWKIGTSIFEPYVISKLISYFKPGQTAITKQDAYTYTILIMLLNVCQSIYIHNYIIWGQQLGIEIKTSFSSLLYRKALKLTPSAVSDITLGNIVTLITKDVFSFQQAIWMLNDMWICGLQSLVIFFLLYNKLGPISFVGIGILFSALPLQALIGKYVSKLRLGAGKKTDDRLQVTQETLSTIKIIKMYTWEKYFADKVDSSRVKEINKMLMGFYLRVILVLIGALFTKVGFYALIMAYTWFGNTTDAEIIFYVLSTFSNLKQSLGTVIPFGMGRAAEVYSSIVRINKVIQAEELHPNTVNDVFTTEPLIDLKNATVHIKDFEVLKGINFKTQSGLTLVTGTVGSGKSSFLKTILQDCPLTTGQLLTKGRISYASQEPWLFPSSIRQNILFGETYNEKRYRDVIKVCALEYDFSLFDKGDQTIVTDRGLNLSKGQQARVNLARAIYKESEIYLLDDSLTALDTHVQDYIFNACIKEYLNDKICILVTQTSNHIQEADNVVIMDAGKIKSHGKPSAKIIEEVNNMILQDDDLEKEVIEENEKNLVHNEKNVEDEDEKEEDSKLIEGEQGLGKKKVYSEINKKGEVEFATYHKYLAFGGGILLFIMNVVLYGLAQGSESYSDMLLTTWVDKQHRVQLLMMNNSHHLISDNLSSEDVANSSIIFDEQLEEAVTIEQNTMKIYSVMIIVSTILAMVKTYALFDFCRRASIKIHKTMVEHVTYAVMAFFDTHFIGNILNRFSQDINNIDEQVPFVFNECFRVAFSVTGIISLIAYVNLHFLMYAALFMSILLVLRRAYLPTGRSLKRLEASTRSPMIGHLNASLEGLTTIRAYKAQNILIDEFDRYQDIFTSAHYTALCTTRAFGFFVDCLCTIFIISVVSKFIFVETEATAGDVGLVITQVFMLSGHVQWGIRQWAELENLMTSVERLMEYTEVELETTTGVEVPQWPNKGAVKFDNVSLSYNKIDFVLKNLNFEITPQQKIGIVGRTGAGKSSILATLFRLYEVEGKIVIDDVDIKTLSLKFLRKKLAIIPQDPILFTGSIRSNLDPLGEFSDVELWSALDKVNLKPSIDSLDMKITGHGTNFSSGQKQLVCLARAILRKNKIVVLDEATANMDHETDVLLHNAIKENFKDCTAFIIAHRLHSILECDRVMVLDKGEIKEFDEPSALLANKNGMFYKMVRQAGLLNYLK